MDFISLPVRIGGNGWLKRSQAPEDAASQLIELMGRTAGEGGWRGMKEFGLRDHMMVMETRRGLQPEAVQAANRTLADLGIEWFRVDGVEKEESSDPSQATYRASLIFAGRGAEVLKVRI
jgi:hypothetical protein